MQETVIKARCGKTTERQNFRQILVSCGFIVFNVKGFRDFKYPFSTGIYYSVCLFLMLHVIDIGVSPC